ncbi:MAG: hypothetical protein KatS3mg087_0639 [Patescibacteria group bacterium]|nr:MAG: hypothetical protein KatS3mg087_0639 [Patescibacteria group bacterium]
MREQLRYGWKHTEELFKPEPEELGELPDETIAEQDIEDAIALWRDNPPDEEFKNIQESEVKE